MNSDRLLTTIQADESLLTLAIVNQRRAAARRPLFRSLSQLPWKWATAPTTMWPHFSVNSVELWSLMTTTICTTRRCTAQRRAYVPALHASSLLHLWHRTSDCLLFFGTLKQQHAKMHNFGFGARPWSALRSSLFGFSLGRCVRAVFLRPFGLCIAYFSLHSTDAASLRHR